MSPTSFPKRRLSLIVGVALSVLFHAIAIWLVLEKNPDVTLTKPFGMSQRLSISLIPKLADAQPQMEPPPSPKKETAKKAEPPKIKVQRRREVVAQKPDPVVQPEVAHAETKQTLPPPTEDMSSMLDAARKRRADAHEHENLAGQEAEMQRRNQVVLANIASSIEQVKGRDQNGRGGVFQLRRVGSISAEFLFKGWSTNLRRNSTQLVEVFKKSEPDIQTAIVEKMIEIIRDNKHDDFVWESNRLGRDVTLSARPENNEQLERFLMLEFFPDYVPPRH